MLLRLPAFLLLLLLLALGACTAGSEHLAPAVSDFGPSPAAPAVPLSAAPDRLPPLPAGREVSAETDTQQTGIAAQYRSAAAMEQGSALLLEAAAEAAGAQWAIYRFQPLPQQTLLSIEVSFDLWSGAGAWIGLSDYSQQRWQLQGPLGASQSFALNNSAHLSPAGNFYCAVLAPPGSSVRVERLTLNLFDPGSQVPVAILDPWEISGSVPLLVKFNAGDSQPAADAPAGLVEYAWDWQDDGVFDLIQAEPQASHSFTAAGVHSVRLRVTDSLGATAEDTAEVLANAPPQPVLQTAGSVDSGEETTLDGSASQDADGQIVRFEWDTDGDGEFELDSGTVASVQVTYNSGGERTVGLRVTDDFGASVTALASLSVLGWSDATTLESDNYCGQFSNLLLVDGLPAVAFHEATNHDVRFMRATDSSGSQWGESITVDADGFSGVDLSMAIVDGVPALSYQDAFEGTLRYVRAGDPAGTIWFSPLVLDSEGYTGRTSCLAVVDGNPAISYGRVGGALLYIRALDSAGVDWGTPQLLDTLGNFNISTSLKMVDNAPAIAYTMDELLRYMRAEDSTGASWAAALTLDAAGSGEGGCSLEIVAGVPAVAFFRGLDLACLRASDAQGSSWLDPQLVDIGFGRGTDCCLRLIGGMPAISYYDELAGDLHYIAATDSAGADWKPGEVLDSEGDTGRWSSLLDRGGKPMISYFDAGKGDLRLISYLP